MNKQLQIAIGKLIGKDYINTVLSTGEELYTDVPTLQDVLLAVDSLGGSNCGLGVHTKIITLWNSKNDVNYDLTKSIFNQTDEVKQQLLELMS